jgi:hypothetical protein
MASGCDRAYGTDIAAPLVVCTMKRRRPSLCNVIDGTYGMFAGQLASQIRVSS